MNRRPQAEAGPPGGAALPVLIPGWWLDAGEPEVGAEDLVVDALGRHAGREGLRTEAAHERQRAAEVDRRVFGNGDAVERHEALVGAVARNLEPQFQFGRLQERDILVHLVPQRPPLELV